MATWPPLHVAETSETGTTFRHATQSELDAVFASIVVPPAEDYRPTVCGSQPNNYGYEYQYGTIGQGTSVTVHRLHGDRTDLEFLWSGIMKALAATADCELPMNPYEVTASVVRVTNETGAVEVGKRIPISRGGEFFFKVDPFNKFWTDPVSGFWPDGQLVKVIAYINTRKSIGMPITTSAGTIEYGKLAADSQWWPLVLNVGDAANAVDQRLGCTIGVEYANHAVTFNPNQYNKTYNGAPAVTITHASAVPPVAIRGRLLSAFDPDRPSVILIGDSIGQGSGAGLEYGNLAPGNGRGFYPLALGHNYPFLIAAMGGQRVQWLVDGNESLFNYRFGLASMADVVVPFLGTNDFVAGASTVNQLKADTQRLWYLSRKAGAKRVVPVTMLPRTNTTDGFQTIENQTQKFPGFYEKADEFNAWQIGMVGNEIEDIFDIRPACCHSPASSQYWRLSEVVGSNVVAAGSTASLVNLVNPVALNSYQQKGILIGNQSVGCWKNSATVLTTNAFANTPIEGAPITVLNQMTEDGTHPMNWGYARAAAAMDLSKLHL